MNKITIFLLGIAPFVVYASSSSNIKKYFDQPYEVKVVNETEYGKDLPKKLLSPEQKKLAEFKTKGYAEEEVSYVKVLLAKDAAGKKEIFSAQNNYNPFDTHLKKNISDIKLAFPYKGVPELPDFKLIGYAPVDTWNNGWTGISTFFVSKDLGVCDYTLKNLTLKHGGVYISHDFARYDINNKPNTLMVKGSVASGFLYTIKWYTDNYANEIECANLKYEEETTQHLIEYAKIINKTLEGS